MTMTTTFTLTPPLSLPFKLQPPAQQVWLYLRRQALSSHRPAQPRFPPLSSLLHHLKILKCQRFQPAQSTRPPPLLSALVVPSADVVALTTEVVSPTVADVAAIITPVAMNPVGNAPRRSRHQVSFIPNHLYDLRPIHCSGDLDQPSVRIWSLFPLNRWLTIF